MHLRYSPNDIVTLRGSVGKGYRTNHVLAENNFLLASGREIVIDRNLDQEEAWNYGISAASSTSTPTRMLYTLPISTEIAILTPIRSKLPILSLRGLP